jgi:hypothetical protein
LYIDNHPPYPILPRFAHLSAVELVEGKEGKSREMLVIRRAVELHHSTETEPQFG